MREPVVAHAMIYSLDNNGMLWLRMFDVRGHLICICPVGPEGAMQLSEFIDDHFCEDEDDEIGEVAGHA